jgi:uncharacterized membrane protein
MPCAVSSACLGSILLTRRGIGVAAAVHGHSEALKRIGALFELYHNDSYTRMKISQASAISQIAVCEDTY